jgi:hypothetical protein
MSPRKFTRPLTALAGVLALALAQAAGAIQITGLTVFKNAGNSADLFDDVGSVAGQRTSTIAIQSSSATTFTTRYAATVDSDSGTAGAVTNIVTLNVDYTITFTVSDAVDRLWEIDVDTRRRGARTAESDGIGQSAFSLTAVVGSLSGSGAITAGSLALAAIARTQQSNDANIAFNQTNSATISGAGNGTVTLRFTFSATAESLVQGNGNNAQGDEAAIRMGIDSTLSSFTAGDYPGVGSRTIGNDGHFVVATITDLGQVPEPSTGLLLGAGLAGYAIHRRSQLRR